MFDPGEPFHVDPHAEPGSTLAPMNRVAAENAAAFVAFLPAGVGSIGVPVEIDRAFSEGKRVVVFSDIKASWVLTYPPSTVVRHNSWEPNAVAWFDRQDEGPEAPGARPVALPLWRWPLRPSRPPPSRPAIAEIPAILPVRADPPHETMRAPRPTPPPLLP